MLQYDIKAQVKNLRRSGNYFSSGYRPAFQVNDEYVSTGEIKLIDKDKLNVGECAEAYIGFLTPEVYPKSMWIGKKIKFMEGNTITGEAIVMEVYNETLLRS